MYNNTLEASVIVYGVIEGKYKGMFEWNIFVPLLEDDDGKCCLFSLHFKYFCL